MSKQTQQPKEVLHTQGEWYVEDSRHGDENDSVVVWGGEEQDILICKMDSITNEDLANAELIVKAVNGWNRLNEDKKFAESVKQALNTQIARLIQSNKELRRALHNCVVTLEALKEKYPDLLGDTTLKEGKTALNNTK